MPVTIVVRAGPTRGLAETGLVALGDLDGPDEFPLAQVIRGDPLAAGDVTYSGQVHGPYLPLGGVPTTGDPGGVRDVAVLFRGLSVSRAGQGPLLQGPETVDVSHPSMKEYGCTGGVVLATNRPPGGLEIPLVSRYCAARRRWR